MLRFCESERPIEWTGFDVRAARPCTACGGMQLDWGVGRDPHYYFMEWRCMSCDHTDIERMQNDRLMFLRSRRNPPVLIG